MNEEEVTDEKRAMAVAFLCEGKDFRVYVIEDGVFSGEVEAARWLERWVGATEVSRSPGCVTERTYLQATEKLRTLSLPKEVRETLTARDVIREREASVRRCEATNVKIVVDGKELKGDALVSVPEPVLKEQLSRADTILGLIGKRVVETGKQFGAFASAHEIFGVLQEEVDEFFDEVKHNGSDIRKISELIDVATVAVRAAVELAERLDHEPTEQEIRNA